MSTELVVRSTDVPEAFDAQMKMAAVVADSSLLPGHLRGKAANVLLVLMGARTLNISAFQALQSIFVVEGKLSISADMMRALMTRAGHKVRVVERTAKRAVVEVHRHDRDTPYRAEFTFEDAVAAKLIKKENYEKYLKAMLVARATSIAWRDECADVAYGVSYTPEELGAAVNEDGSAKVDNEGKVVLDGEVIAPPTQDMIDNWHTVLFEAELHALPAAWEHIVSRKATAGKHSDGGEWSLSQQMANRMVQEAGGALTVEEVRELWRISVLMGVMELVAPNGQSVVDALKAQPGRIQEAEARRAAQDAAAEQPPAPVAAETAPVIEVDLDDIERPVHTADPETTAANLATWGDEVDSTADPA